jgi:hypothetical protein
MGNGMRGLTDKTRYNYLDEERDSRGRFSGKKQKQVFTPKHEPYTPPPFTPLAPLGTLTVRLFGDDITITGGPFKACPPHMIGVKMAAEIDWPHDVSIPTQDFKTPPRDRFEEGMLAALTCHFIDGDPIYVGCFAGKGRTGLFLATLAYLCGEDEPVKFVRANYYAHAVETPDQEKFVTSFDRETFRRRLMKVLIGFNAISWGRLRRMTWADRLLYLKLVFAR